MSEPLRGVIVAHGGLAAALVDAVERIAGAGSGLVPVSNTDCDRGALEDRIMAAIGDVPGIVFIDMPSGSCLFAAMRRLQAVSTVRVVTGVNLAMLLEFLFRREEPLEVVVQAVVETGSRAVAVR